MKKLLALACLGLMSIAGVALAASGGNELMYQKVQELTTLPTGEITSSDYIPVYDASTGQVKKVQADVVATPDGVTASTADLNATTNFEETISATTSEVTIKTAKTLDITDVGGLQINNVAVGASAAELNMAADISANFEVVAATNVLTSAECGKTMTLAHATEFVSTLPAPTAGCKFKFIVGLAPTGASYTVVTNSSANIITAGINELEVDTGDDGPYSATADTITFVDGVSVKGDFVDCVSDGTSWFCNGQANADGGITLSST